MKLPTKMKAMVTMGHGGIEQMVFHTDSPPELPGSPH